MKRLFGVAGLLLILLAGCSNEPSGQLELRTCVNCFDEVDRWIDLAEDDSICARCFSENGYQVCSGCGFAYDPSDTDSTDGYCAECTEQKTWNCALCDEGRHALDDLADLGNGYYLCADCALECLELTEEIPWDDQLEMIPECSLFISRDEYLAQ